MIYDKEIVNICILYMQKAVDIWVQQLNLGYFWQSIV